MNHTDILNRLVACFEYSTYLEIGVANGSNFNAITVPRENKVGVDPQLTLDGIYKISSDDFFLTNKNTFDLIFIDGLHHSDQVYRDIINALSVLNHNGTILCHDISPNTIEQQIIPRIQKSWTGDCWKAWVKLRAERSDLTMEVVDSDYGCGIIRRGYQKPIELPSQLTWQTLVLNRQSLLNLTEINTFKTHYVPPIKYFTASHDETILSENLLKSELFKGHLLTIQRNFDNVGKAYNSIPPKQKVGRCAWIHHDVFLPPTFEKDLLAALDYLDKHDPQWGVLGVAGVKLVHGNRVKVGHLLSKGQYWGAPMVNLATEVDTLDELLLITQYPTTFDEKLGNHFYGADLCLQSKMNMKKIYAIRAFVHHNVNQKSEGSHSQSFHISKNVFINKYFSQLPIATTCGIWNIEKEAALIHIHKPKIFYSSPYDTSKCIGRAYSAFMELLPSGSFGCLTDADATFTISNYGHLIEKAVLENPHIRVFVAKTNRIGCSWQQDNEAPNTDDMRMHRCYGKLVSERFGASVTMVSLKHSFGSGFFILLRKDLWDKVKFQEKGMLGVDNEFFKRVLKLGEPIFQLQGIYLYHWYRGGDRNNTSHLK